MATDIIDKQKTIKIDRRAVRRLVKRILAEHSRDDCDLSVVFADDAFVRELNLAYRKVDRATDVLAFAMRDVVPIAEWKAIDGPENVLGDVVISVDRARVQARRYRRTVDHEILKLVAHGVLHLLGFDHERTEDRREMRRLENRYARAALRSGGTKRRMST
jgi:probable rRNA maturation factor